MIIKNKNGFYQIKELILPGLIHGFSTKQLGNMSYKYTSKTRVSDNRSRFAKLVGFDPNNLVQMGLVHGTNIKIVTAAKYEDQMDAIVTKKKGLPLWLLTADCAPFIFYDPTKKIIALAHVGWKGALAGLPSLVVKKMTKGFGSNPADVIVGVGPAIGQCCYTFDKIDTWPIKYLEKKGGKTHVDFVGYSIDGLRKTGVTKIYTTDYCVRHRSDFFSFRRERELGEKRGRFATVVQME